MQTALELPVDHPGVSDPVYRARRGEIVGAAERVGMSGRPEHIEYTSAENEVWATVSSALAPLHQRYAVNEYRRAAAALDLPTDRVPQLAMVSDRLTELTGWRVCAVPGLVSSQDFFGLLADRCFPSSQYVRHPSVPFYTPEPDVIHELVGHANSLASPALADLYEAAGRAAMQIVDPAALARLGRLFWFTIEFGVAMERHELRTYGAGLLSSFGEITEFRRAELRPFDTDAMADFADYEISTFQHVLFAAESFEAVSNGFLRFLDSLVGSASREQVGNRRLP